MGLLGWNSSLFFNEFVPKLDTHIILVTALRDPYTPMDETEQAFLDNPKLIKWYTVNPSPEFVNHTKLVGVPIGVNRFDAMSNLVASYR